MSFLKCKSWDTGPMTQGLNKRKSRLLQQPHNHKHEQTCRDRNECEEQECESYGQVNDARKIPPHHKEYPTFQQKIGGRTQKPYRIYDPEKDQYQKNSLYSIQHSKNFREHFIGEV